MCVRLHRANFSNRAGRSSSPLPPPRSPCSALSARLSDVRSDYVAQPNEAAGCAVTQPNEAAGCAVITAIERLLPSLPSSFPSSHPSLSGCASDRGVEFNSVPTRPQRPQRPRRLSPYNLRCSACALDRLESRVSSLFNLHSRNSSPAVCGLSLRPTRRTAGHLTRPARQRGRSAVAGQARRHGTPVQATGGSPVQIARAPQSHFFFSF